MDFTLNGATLYYEIHGEGEPLLLLHGWMGQINSWAPLIRDLKSSRKLIAVDFPGQGGKSPEPPEPWSVTEHMELIAALLHHLGIEQTDIVAHSFGGRVTLLLAATYPSLAGKLVITGGAGLIPKKTVKKRVRSFAYKAMRGLIDSGLFRNLLGNERVEKLRDKLRDRFGSSDYKALAPSMRGTFNRVVTQDLRFCLEKIQSPTLLIWGARDDQTPLWMGQVMEKEIKDAGLIVYEDAGHFAYLDRYPDFLAVVKNFLKITP